jgi:hypothetical protein
LLTTLIVTFHTLIYYREGGFGELNIMPEERSEVKTFEIRYICDRCKTGKMIFTGEQIETYPPYNIHRCDDCYVRDEFLDVIYPHYEYE